MKFTLSFSVKESNVMKLARGKKFINLGNRVKPHWTNVADGGLMPPLKGDPWPAVGHINMLTMSIILLLKL